MLFTTSKKMLKTHAVRKHKAHQLVYLLKLKYIAIFRIRFERAGIGLTTYIIRFHFKAEVIHQHFAIRRKM